MEPLADLVVRIVLAVLFTAAGVDKLRDRRRFDGIVLDYRLLPPHVALRIAAFLPWLEIALAMGMLTGVRAAHIGAALLLLLYGAAMAINLARGRRLIDCGCGGEPERLSGWLLLRNAALAAAAVLVA